MIGIKKVLVVEDNQGFRELLKCTFEDGGFKIFSACNGKEDLERSTIVDYLRNKLVGQTARIQTDINGKGFAKIDKVLVWVLPVKK